MALEKLDIHMQKNQVRPFSNILHTKINSINSKGIHDLNVKPKARKLIEENIGLSFATLDLAMISWRDTKGTGNKRKK